MEEATQENTVADFGADAVTLTVRLATQQMQLRLALMHFVTPDKCRLRISSGKGPRLTLVKAEKGYEWHDLTRLSDEDACSARRAYR